VQYLRASSGHKSYRAKVQYMAYWRTVFGGCTLGSLTTEAIASKLPTHRRSACGAGIALSAATKNRYLESLRAMLHLCERLGWIERVPRLNKLHEAKVRLRFLTKAQARVFIEALQLDWMRQTCRFALATGMRLNEILSLTWDKVDVARAVAWVSADLAKSGAARCVPLNAEAQEVLHQCQGCSAQWVFTGAKGKKLTDVNRPMLARAYAAAGVKDFRFHDLRHTWASWHVQGGTPLLTLKELGGWKTLEMVMRYAHLAPEHLAQHASAVMFWSQPDSSPQKMAA